MNAHSTELLIIKTGNGYVREKDGVYETCAMERASVFPLGHLPDVKKHVEILRDQYGMASGLFKLTIIEEPFKEREEA
jgi:hypothetical protein